MFTYFKNDSIKKLVIAFGNIFNNVQIEQKNADGTLRDFVIPLSYSSKEKFIKRLSDPSSISEQTRIEISLPKMSFELSNLTYDPLRKMNKLSRKILKNTANTIAEYAFSEIPYNFNFNLMVYTRNIEENLDIIGQILTYFGPEFIVSVNMSDFSKSVDVPIVIVQTNLTQEYEGDFGNRRFIVSSFQFVAKSYVYAKTDVSPLVQTAGICLSSSILIQ